jgi:hypothetical protein
VFDGETTVDVDVDTLDEGAVWQEEELEFEDGIVQKMCFPLAHMPLLYGEPKGFKIILEECGLWQLGL